MNKFENKIILVTEGMSGVSNNWDKFFHCEF